MTAKKMGEERESQELLEALVVGNDDLERLESLLDVFNIFEAVGPVRQELRHSYFLAYILDPQQNHGLGDDFLKRFLQAIVLKERGRKLPFSAIDLDLWNLEDSTVLREWQCIDILILNEEHNLAVVIENKIGSTEHSDQLRRYRETIAAKYPETEWNVLYVYLTPEGEMPSQDEYIPVDYGLVFRVLEDVSRARRTTLGTDVVSLLEHYGQVLRRHVMGDSEIIDLCKRIYRRHKRALDLIYEHRPDRRSELYDYLLELIGGHPGMMQDHCTVSAVRFLPKTWDVPVLKSKPDWTPTGRMFLFQIDNTETRVVLKLIIGPGPDDVRKRLLKMAREHTDVFNATTGGLNAKYKTIHVEYLLKGKALEEGTVDELKKEIKNCWKRFLASSYPQMHKVVSGEEWLGIA